MTMSHSTQFRPIRALINLAALQQNLRHVKAYAPESKILAIIKANGYGHGLDRAATQLVNADGFGVASIDEAISLRQKGFLHPIVILEGLFSEAELEIAVQHRLDIALHNHQQLDWLANGQWPTPMNIWVKVDTGMHRLGFEPYEVDAVVERLQRLSSPVNVHLMSHFASADSDDAFTQTQLSRFDDVASRYDFPQSLANSAGIQGYADAHRDWVRPGIMLYGACATHETVPNLKPVMTLESQITSLKWIEEGESVGYSQTWQAPRRSLIAVVAVGYGDGYPRHAPTGTPVWTHGQTVPLVGRVSMDMITIDVTDLADKVELGDRVELWGENLRVDCVAKASGTIGYELLCGVTARVPKMEVR